MIPSFMPAVVGEKNGTLLNVTAQFIEFERTELLTVFGDQVGHGGKVITDSTGQEMRLGFNPKGVGEGSAVG